MDFGFSEEQRMFANEVKRFAAKEIVPRSAEHDLAARFDRESFRKLGDFGILGLHFPEKYGGSNADVVTTTLAGYALGAAGVDGGLTLSYGAHSFLCADTIFVHGSEAQRRKYLPGLASGQRVGAMGLTEPGAGSDAAALRTTAKKTDSGWVLNGSKMFITNGPVADVALIYARTDAKDRHGGVSAFVIEKGTPGFSSGKPLTKMGVKASPTSELLFDDCEIPAENLVGQQGKGFDMALQTVEWDRSALLAPMVGAMEYALAKSARYAKQREQFGRPISKFQATRRKLAEMKVYLEAAKGLIFRVAWCKDQGRSLNLLQAAVAKLFVGDWSLVPSNEALLLFGGYGYCHEFEVERFFRDCRLAPIAGGTSDIQKMIISKML